MMIPLEPSDGLLCPTEQLLQLRLFIAEVLAAPVAASAGVRLQPACGDPRLAVRSVPPQRRYVRSAWCRFNLGANRTASRLQSSRSPEAGALQLSESGGDKAPPAFLLMHGYATPRPSSPPGQYRLWGFRSDNH